jgi:hypothetical protein
MKSKLFLNGKPPVCNAVVIGQSASKVKLRAESWSHSEQMDRGSQFGRTAGAIGEKGKEEKWTEGIPRDFTMCGLGTRKRLLSDPYCNI